MREEGLERESSREVECGSLINDHRKKDTSTYLPLPCCGFTGCVTRLVALHILRCYTKISVSGYRYHSLPSPPPVFFISVFTRTIIAIIFFFPRARVCVNKNFPL